MENKVKEQIITDDYAIYNSDCMLVLPTLSDESVDLCVYSPPFHNLYTYSSSPNDFSNCETKEQFLEQYKFLIKELNRVTKSGRIHGVHCTDLFKYNGALDDFPSDIIKLYQDNGFTYMCRITIWKEPLKVRLKTMVQSLMHKFIIEDSTKNYPAMPDYILLFKKKGDNKVPVTHPNGLKRYFGERPILPNILTAWNNANNSNLTESELWEHLNKKYYNSDEPSNKLSHVIWQRYASALWDDIDDTNCLSFKDSKEEDDEKHITPTQINVIDRLVELYSNPNEVVLTPFMGVGTEVYSPVSLGRKAIGIELKDSYFKQAILNLKEAKNRFNSEENQLTLF